MALAALLLQPRLAGAAITPTELQQLAQSTTFEVVLPKIEPTTIQYEKPLPLELLSYTERTDKFWSIGTAFSISPGVFVSAAHVLMSAMGSPMGQPMLRDGEGNTYPVEQVLQFSLHHDYIVFRAKGLPAGPAIEPNRSPVTGSPVHAVGNALGDGVVVRSGLLTSQTPEDQDGRWKWLRFSAAASPGNSGGPLLDDEGKVIGVITAKSPGENLNFALPIDLVLDGSRKSAVIDLRSSFGVPILRQQLVTTFTEQFPLPADWKRFSRMLMEYTSRQFQRNQQRLLDEQAAELPPRGNIARLSATLDRDIDIGLLTQKPDDTWGLTAAVGEEETELPDGGHLWTGTLPGAGSFRLQRPGTAADPALYADAGAFMDTLLKGLKIPRIVGSQAIRITSLGQPQVQETLTDRFGRTWQLRSWTLGYADMQLVTLALPTPEGYAGLIQLTPASTQDSTVTGLRLLADYFHVIYRGSLKQWRALQSQPKLWPPFLSGIRLEVGADLSLSLRGLDVRVPATLLAIDDESELAMQMYYRPAASKLTLAMGGMTLHARPGDDNSWIGIWSQPRPTDKAGSKLLERWQKMESKEGDFSGQPRFDGPMRFWSGSTYGDPEQDLLFEIVLSWREKGLLPRQVSERRDRLLSGLKLVPLPKD